jgi:hypothetical protein
MMSNIAYNGKGRGRFLNVKGLSYLKEGRRGFLDVVKMGSERPPRAMSTNGFFVDTCLGGLRSASTPQGVEPNV